MGTMSPGPFLAAHTDPSSPLTSLSLACRENGPSVSRTGLCQAAPNKGAFGVAGVWMPACGRGGGWTTLVSSRASVPASHLTQNCLPGPAVWA